MIAPNHMWHGDPSVRWIEQPLAVIDFETTGLSPDNDRVLEVGLACFSRGELTRLEFWLVNPGRAIPAESRRVHGIGDRELAMAPQFEQVLAELTPRVGGHVPVAYNAVFDQAFLRSEQARLPQPPSSTTVPPMLTAGVTWIDPLVWLREIYRNQDGYRLADMCSLTGIQLRRAHRASHDAEAAGRLLLSIADSLPATWGELVRLQRYYAASQVAAMPKRRHRPHGPR